MKHIKIEKNVPIPPTQSTGRKPKYPWREMKVGDSFFCSSDPNTFRSQVYRAAQIYGVKLSARTVEENGVKGMRVWRIE